MYKSIEIEAVNIKSAIRQALKQLGASRNKVEIVVLREEKGGLFGMKGARQAKVRVTIKKNT